MTSAFVYLTWCTFRNRVRARVRRLREPRYLIGAIVGIAYFYFVVFRQRPGGGSGGGGGGRGPQGLIPLFERFRGTVELGGSLVLFISTALAWVLPSSGSAVAFTNSEVQFLFPAPITRAELIRYRLIRSQMGVIVGSAIMTIFFRPSSIAGGWTFFLGMAIIFAAVNLHMMGVNLSRQSLSQHGSAGLSRQWLPLGVIVVAMAVLASAVAMDWSRLAGLEDVSAIVGELQRVSLTMPASIVLWPFRALVKLPLSPSPMEFLKALPAAALVIFLNYRWVQRSDVAFEEASAAAAEKTAASLSRGRRRATPKVRGAATPFNLALVGRPETAIFWKNLILVGRYASLKTIFRLVPIIIVLGFVISRATAGSGVSAVLAFVAGWVGVFTILMGPQIARNDLRRDLTQLEVIKTWPIRGAALIRGEIAAPAAVLTAITWICVLVATVLAVSLPQTKIDWSRAELVSVAVGAALVAPGLILVQLLVHNTLAILFPAWVVMGASRARGIDVMGQRMLMMAGMFLALALAMLPALLAAGIVGYAIYLVLHVIPIVLPALIAAVVLVVECVVATEMLGGVLERTDISAIPADEA